MSLKRIISYIPIDRGLEVEALFEVYCNYSPGRIFQAQICETYDPKYQPLITNDPITRLMTMVLDIAKSIFGNLAIEGIILSGTV